MKRLASVVLAGCAGHAVPATPHADPIAGARAAAAAFDHAQLVGDRATMDRYLASDFVFVRGSGKVADRAAFLAAFTDPNQTLAPFVVVNPVAIALSDTAVIIGGETTMTGTDKGEPFSEHFRYADIFQLRDGRWQAVYTQVTMLK